MDRLALGIPVLAGEVVTLALRVHPGEGRDDVGLVTLLDDELAVDEVEVAVVHTAGRRRNGDVPVASGVRRAGGVTDVHLDGGVGTGDAGDPHAGDGERESGNAGTDRGFLHQIPLMGE